ncbi:MAG: helix-turn-helix domain-containing protein [Acidimicrobiales bacterium]
MQVMWSAGVWRRSRWSRPKPRTTVGEVAEAFGVDPDTLRKWRRAREKDGAEGLRSEKRGPKDHPSSPRRSLKLSATRGARVRPWPRSPRCSGCRLILDIGRGRLASRAGLRALAISHPRARGRRSSLWYAPRRETRSVRSRTLGCSTVRPR